MFERKYISTSGSSYILKEELPLAWHFHLYFIEVNDCGKCLYINWTRIIFFKAWKKVLRPQNQCQTPEKGKRVKFGYQLSYIFKIIQPTIA